MLRALLSFDAGGQAPLFGVDESSLLLFVEDSQGEAPLEQLRLWLSSQLGAALAPSNSSTGNLTFSWA